MINTKQRSKRTLQIFALLAVSALLCKCKKDVVTPGNVPDATMNRTMDTTARSFTATNSLSTTTSYNLTSSLPSGYVTNGTKDYTSYIQAALNSHTNVTFPAFPIMINDAGLLLNKSNVIYTFPAGSKLILKPTSSTNYTILRVERASNVTLTNPVIVGDRYKHIGTTGEWGQGLGIYGCTNVTVTTPNVTNCWGDGIYLASKNGVGNYTIHITNASCVSNRRNGISVTNAVGLVLDAPYAAYCDGTAPYTGIDFEAGSYADNLQNITINNALTDHNKGNGISVGFRNLYGGSNKTISFTINNPVDIASGDGFKTSASLTRQVGSETVTGPLTIVSPKWEKNSVSPIQTNLLVRTIKLAISKPTIMNMSGVWLSNSSALSLMTYKTNINSGSNYSITF